MYLKNQGNTPLVIDSDQLLENPESYLQKICKILGISFTKEMLSWQKGGIEQDGIWAQYWYSNVHNSTGFEIQKSSAQSMPNSLQTLLDQALTLLGSNPPSVFVLENTASLLALPHVLAHICSSLSALPYVWRYVRPPPFAPLVHPS